MNKLEDSNSLDLSRRIIDIASDQKADDILLLDVRPQIFYTDFLVFFSMDTDRQINAIVREIESQLKINGSSLYTKEGLAENGWVAIDFFDVIVHIFKPEVREIYQLEKFFESSTELVRMI